jgi:hypothetical protein
MAVAEGSNKRRRVEGRAAEGEGGRGRSEAVRLSQALSLRLSYARLKVEFGWTNHSMVRYTVPMLARWLELMRCGGLQDEIEKELFDVRFERQAELRLEAGRIGAMVTAVVSIPDNSAQGTDEGTANTTKSTTTTTTRKVPTPVLPPPRVEGGVKTYADFWSLLGGNTNVPLVASSSLSTPTLLPPGTITGSSLLPTPIRRPPRPKKVRLEEPTDEIAIIIAPSSPRRKITHLGPQVSFSSLPPPPPLSFETHPHPRRDTDSFISFIDVKVEGEGESRRGSYESEFPFANGASQEIAASQEEEEISMQALDEAF